MAKKIKQSRKQKKQTSKFAKRIKVLSRDYKKYKAKGGRQKWTNYVKANY